MKSLIIRNISFILIGVLSLIIGFDRQTGIDAAPGYINDMFQIFGLTIIVTGACGFRKSDKNSNE